MLIKAIYSNCEIPLSRILAVNINESIHSPVIEGSFIFKVEENKKDIFDYSNKTLIFLLYDTIRDKQFMLRYEAYSEQLVSNSITCLKEVHIEFTSTYGVDMINVNRSVEFNGMKYSDMIKRLLSELNITTDKWTESNGLYTEVLPLTDRLDSINRILDKCVDSSNSGGFLLFPTLLDNKMNLLTYSSLRKFSIGKYDKMLVNFDIHGYDYIGKMQDFQIINDVDTIESIEQGLNAYKCSGMDFDTGVVKTFVYDVKQSVAGDDTIKGKMLMDKKFISSEYALSKPFYVGQKEIKNRLNNELQHKLNNCIKANCSIVGDYTRKLGSYVDVLVQSDNNRSIDEMLSDRYLISAINHNLSIREYTQQLTLIKPVYRNATGEKLVSIGI